MGLRVRLQSRGGIMSDAGHALAWALCSSGTPTVPSWVVQPAVPFCLLLLILKIVCFLLLLQC
jgi:hypothetical protein